MDTDYQKDTVLEPARGSGENMVPEPDPACGTDMVLEAASDPGKEKDPGKRTMEELEQENQRLREEHELLLREYRASLPLKERMYDRVPLTVRQLDVIIGFLLAALAAVIILGLVDR